jgi:hypothetical protein
MSRSCNIGAMKIGAVEFADTPSSLYLAHNAGRRKREQQSFSVTNKVQLQISVVGRISKI